LNHPDPQGASRPYGRFFLPGPVEVHPDVLAAQLQPMTGHRGPDVQAWIAELQVGLKDAFRTDRPVFMVPCSGTGLMEAAVRNGASTKVLSLVNGAFSQRFADIARQCGIEVDELSIPWGEAHDAARVADALSQGTYQAVTVAHSETSTGVLNDLASISQVVHEHDDTLLFVDSVSGAAGAELQTDAWGLDYVLTGGQKAFSLPPGLAFCVASDAMIERAKGIENRGYYFDLVRYEDNIKKLQTPTTPALSTLFALQVQLQRMADETMEVRWVRHISMAERTWSWVDDMVTAGVPLGVTAAEGHRSPTVTAVVLPEGVTGPSVVGAVQERGWVIGGGYGKLKDTTFRIGHMGEHTMDELEALLEVLTEVLA
jgi:predicted phosphoserine aminotransferase